MTNLALKFDDEKHNFESYAHENGIRFWYARELMAALGYESFDTFEKACINKAIGVCTTLKIPVLENFQQEKREIDGKPVWDYRLSRFACYLVAMNGDSKKPQVAAAQAFFASMAEAMRKYIENSENLERVLIRDDVSERERSLSGVAHAAGVVQYGFFQNAGYRGMYNMDLRRLRQWKGIESDRSLLDFMGKQELAANLFRITQTEARIRNERIRGQRSLENAAHEVGRSVRETMIKTSGSKPEQLPIAEDIKVVRKGLKSAEKQFAKLDKSGSS
ncbi:MAG: BRO family protein [Candidatus Angelobacter sp.]|jgi:DNA-damage-inducible protein D